MGRVCVGVGEGGGEEEAGIFHTAVKTINITGERLWIKAGATLALGSRVCVGVVCLAQLLEGVVLLQCPGVASSRRRVFSSGRNGDSRSNHSP